MDEAVGRDFLTHLVSVEKVAFSTQKQALNALVFFLRESVRAGGDRSAGEVEKDGAEGAGDSEQKRADGNGREAGGALPDAGVAAIWRGAAAAGAGAIAGQRGGLGKGCGDGALWQGGQGSGNDDPELSEGGSGGESSPRRGCLWEADRAAGVAGVALPGALARKMPRAGEKFAWMWVFPSGNLAVDPESGVIRRHHIHPKAYGEAIRRAAAAAGIEKRVTTHALRHAFATDLLRGGTDIRTLQELLGHADVKTTEIYAHAAEIGNGKGVVSPLDAAGLIGQGFRVT